MTAAEPLPTWLRRIICHNVGRSCRETYIAVDRCSAECVGIHASRSADRFETLEPVKQAVRERWGAFAKCVAAGLHLRHDHGSQYVSHHFQTEIRFLGIESSPGLRAAA